METHLVGSEINTVSSHHVESGVGDVYDAGYTEDEGESDSEQSEYAPTDETAYDDVYNEIHMTSNFNHKIRLGNKLQF